MENEFNQILDEIFSEKYTGYTNYSVLDLILNHTIHKENWRSIETDVHVDISDELYIDRKVLCVVNGDAMKNVIEAYRTLKSKCIHICIMQQNSNLYIDISNP